MANVKITDLAVYTAPKTTDVLPIVDVGADVTKKVSVGDFVGTMLPPGTAAQEYLQWNATLSSWQPSTELNGGSF